jgi:hypothetical protein
MHLQRRQQKEKDIFGRQSISPSMRGGPFVREHYCEVELTALRKARGGNAHCLTTCRQEGKKRKEQTAFAFFRRNEKRSLITNSEECSLVSFFFLFCLRRRFSKRRSWGQQDSLMHQKSHARPAESICGQEEGKTMS